MPYADRERQLAYQRNWNKRYYSDNKEEERRRIRDRKNEIATWFKEYRSRLVCVNCGESETACLEFHHKNAEEKEFSLALVDSWGWGKAKIEKEIAKCVVLCANCHRKEHARMRHKDCRIV